MATATVQAIEQFHLLFLFQLARRVDKRTFVLEGGCNLRFFLNSIRYSEYMDLDVGMIETQVLRDRVRDVFASRPFARILEARGIQIEHVTEHKQTDTTQRWTLGLRVAGTPVPLPTKVEFSRRRLDDGVAFGSVNASISRAYQLPPLMLSHYDAAAALRQKVQALAGRPQPQARDVLDLHHLLFSGAGAGALHGLRERTLAVASANALSVDYSSEEQVRFDSPSTWDSMVLEVVETLGRKPS